MTYSMPIIRASSVLPLSEHALGQVLVRLIAVMGRFHLQVAIRATGDR
jgi:hypothetical protein